MSIVANQQRTFLALTAQLRTHWHRDRNLPARIHTLLASNRAFGSRDRRLYRELLYTTLRYLPWIEPHLDADPDLAANAVAWLAADSRATEKYRAGLILDWPPCPPSVAEKSAILSNRLARALPAPLPDWFQDHCPPVFESPQIDTLLTRAPLWLRLRPHAFEQIARDFQQLGWSFERSSILPAAIRVLDEVDVTKSKSFQSGLVEVQDLGSQLLLASVGAKSDGHWLDACAGAGGKTLQLAALLGPAGSIDAHDVRAPALDELALRARRAGIEVADARTQRAQRNSANRPATARTSRDVGAPIRIIEKPDDLYDGVLVDAPCSGSGTWRRAPHLKWTTSPRDIHAAAALQVELLERFSRHVRPGGRLIYATCSLSRYENEGVIASFVRTHPEFSLERVTLPGIPPAPLGATLLPAVHNTDGFFVSSVRRIQPRAATALGA